MVAGTHVLIEVIRLVHLVRFGLLRVEPALEELRVVLLQDTVPLLDLSELELERADLVVEDLKRPNIADGRWKKEKEKENRISFYVVWMDGGVREDAGREDAPVLSDPSLSSARYAGRPSASAQ